MRPKLDELGVMQTWEAEAQPRARARHDVRARSARPPLSRLRWLVHGVITLTKASVLPNCGGQSVGGAGFATVASEAW